MQVFARRFNLDIRALQTALVKSRQQADLFDAQLAKRVELQASSIHRSLGKPAAFRSGADAHDEEALHDHWWVQIRRDASWLDLDVTLPDPKAGDRVGPPPAETLAFAPLEKLPEALLHSVQIRVVLECSQSGKLTEHTPALESPSSSGYSARPARAVRARSLQLAVKGQRARRQRLT